jgi:hypothetical protein
MPMITHRSFFPRLGPHPKKHLGEILRLCQVIQPLASGLTAAALRVFKCLIKWTNPTWKGWMEVSINPLVELQWLL